MVKDFLDHLMWEVRINHAENTSLKGRVNVELAESLGKYMRRYGTTLRAGFTVRVPPGMPPEVARRAFELVQQHRTAEHQRYIDALESLQPLFKEAFYCASGSPVDIVADAERILDGSFFKVPPAA